MLLDVDGSPDPGTVKRSITSPTTGTSTARTIACTVSVPTADLRSGEMVLKRRFSRLLICSEP